MSFDCRLMSVLVLLFVVAPVWAQQTLSLQEAKTYEEVGAYFQQEVPKLGLDKLAPKERAKTIAGLLMPVSEKLLEIAKTPQEKQRAYEMKLNALTNLLWAQVEWAGVDRAEQKMEAFLKELAAKEGTEEIVETFQFQYLLLQIQIRGFAKTEQKFETFLTELAAKEKTERRTHLLRQGRFFLFMERAEHAEVSPENFSQFKAELKTWIDQDVELFETILSLGFEIAFKNKVPAEQLVKELSEFLQGCKLPTGQKKEMIAAMEAKAHLALGVDPKLYGKTLDDKDFQWESLRGKYVLVKFTATWCGPCKMQIPGLLEAYKKYHDKGLEIISVYVFEHSADPVASVKQAVSEEKLPWIILSEALSEKAKHPNYGEFYGIEGVPTIVLVDKEGKIMIPATHGDEWKTKLEEIFPCGPLAFTGGIF